MEYLLFLVGFILLVGSGDLLVRAGVSLAKHLKISAMVIGVTIISLGTSLPELFVSASAALSGEPEISIGNVVGSNIANIALVLALTSIILPIIIQPSLWKFEAPIMLFATFLFVLFIWDQNLARWEGILFVGLLIAAVFSIFHRASSARSKEVDEISESSPKFGVTASIAILIVSCIGLKFGADWMVDGAVSIAEKFNISKTIISVTLIAFGTSVPELATSIIAALKKEMDISVGNIIGSNIFNIFGVLGVTASIHPIQITEVLTIKYNLWIMVMVAILLFVFMLPVFKRIIARWQGVILFVIYILYIYFLIHMQS